MRSRRISHRFLQVALPVSIALSFTSVRAADTHVAHPNATAEAHYPFMAMWAQAGLTHGVPTALPVVATVKPGDDLQAAIDHVPESGGVIAFAAGEYILTETLRLRSGVFLRGAGLRTTKLHLKLRGTKPAAAATDAPLTRTTAILLQSVKNAGLANFTVSFDESLPPPPDPRTSHTAYQDNPGGREDLHVVAVRFTAARECWITNCLIRNSGTDPLVIEASQHISASSVEINGAYNRGPRSGRLDLAGSDYVLLDDLVVRDINHFVVRAASRYNVVINSRIEVDVRFNDTATTGNLLQNTVVAVPVWHNRPAISQGRADDGERPPGAGNLLYLCTVTRSFMSGGRSFSLADNPTRVYRVLENYSNDASVADAGAAPPTGSLWLAP